jgi:hypothetical protein
MTASPRPALIATSALAALALGSSFLPAQNDAGENRPPANRREPRTNRPDSNAPVGAKRENAVSITTEGDFRVIKSNGWPDHAPGEFPRRGNPNTASPQDYTFRVPLKPQPAPEPVRRGGWFFAVAVNGVPFEPGTAETWNNDRTSGWRYEAYTGFLDLGLDEHHAHVQPTGAYHYHATPTGLVQKLGGDEGKMLPVGWAADGYELFTANCGAGKDGGAIRAVKSSWRLKTGARPEQAGGPGGNYDGRFTEDWEFAQDSGDLDALNGHVAPTPAHPEGIYHYHITTQFPFLPRGWRGTPDESFGKGGPGGRRLGAGRGGPGGPPDHGGAPGQPDGQGARPGAQGGMPGGFPPPLIIRTLDANGDGVIDAEEIASAASALRKLDRNGDGKLTPDEYRDPGAPFGRPPPGPQGERPDGFRERPPGPPPL